MKVLFIFNSNKFIGKGHESRCMNIASELVLMGCDVHLATSTASNISEHNLQIFQTINFFDDIANVVSGLKKNSNKYISIVIDTYDISPRELIDVCDNCSIYKFELSPDLNEKRIKFITFDPYYVGKSPFHCFGPQYFPLNKKFIDAQKKKILKNNSMFVFFGGGNNSNLISKYSDYFAHISKNGFEVNIVVTNFYTDLPEISKKMDFVNIVKEPDNIAELIMQNSLSFISGGTIIYECIFMGHTPQVISIAQNQINQSLSFHNSGNIRYIGKSDDVSSQALINDFKKNRSNHLNNNNKFPPKYFNIGLNLLAKEIYHGFK
jgi:spore coat polysaccharide biosynthesis predicted glycosyltransferase SpsG